MAERLDGWKAIAAFLNRDERTVRRWEETRALPVHRLPGGERARVWADPEDLRRWLASGPEPQEPARPRLPVRPRWPWLAAGLAVAMLGGGAWVAAERPAKTAYAGDADAEALHQRALFLWNGRTRASIDQAIPLFEALIRRHPDRAEAYAGLADCYLLAREFGSLDDRVAFARARAAAEAALQRDPRAPAALRALAFVRFWGDGDASALALFESAVRAEPESALALLWYANALSSRGRHAEADAAFEAARARDPANPAILGDQAMNMLFAGRTAEAGALIDQVAAVAPQLASVQRARFLVELARGRDAAALDAAGEAARLRGDPAAQAAVVAARDAHRAGGRAAMLAAFAEAGEARARRGGFGLVEAAWIRRLAGDHAGAARLLAAAAAPTSRERVSAAVFLL